MPEFLREIFGPFTPILIPALRIGWILILGYIILKLIDSALRRLRLLIPSGDVLGVARVEQRTETLRLVIRSVSKVVVIVLVVLTISAELNFEIGPILASAGIVGLAVGFGAQSLVKDVITGAFIVLEHQFSVGDVVKIGDRSGVVENLGVRTTTLRDIEGTAHIIPNSKIEVVSVMTKDWSQFVLDVDVAYDTDLDKAMGAIKKVLSDYAKEFPSNVLGDPQVLGIE